MQEDVALGLGEQDAIAADGFDVDALPVPVVGLGQIGNEVACFEVAAGDDEVLGGGDVEKGTYFGAAVAMDRLHADAAEVADALGCLQIAVGDGWMGIRADVMRAILVEIWREVAALVDPDFETGIVFTGNDIFMENTWHIKTDFDRNPNG